MRDGSACLLTKVAIATPDAVLIIELHFDDPNNPADVVDHTALYTALFNPDNVLSFVGFNLDRLALQLFGEYGMYICNGIDLFSMKVNSIDDPRGANSFINAYKGDLDVAVTTELLDNENDTLDNDPILATRAWVGAVLDQASETLSVSLAAATPINVSLLQPEV